MGRYRPLVAALVHHVNTVTRSTADSHFIYENIYLAPNEWQVLEYIVEHSEDDQHMIDMSNALAIPQSSFSKMIKKLCGIGLVDRYRSVDNKKNIILKPTELAVKAYEFHTAELYRKMFKPFFDELEEFSDEDIEKFTHAIMTFSKGANLIEGPIKEADAKLIKIE